MTDPGLPLKRLVFWCAVIAVGLVSLLPRETLPETGLWDKLEHAAAYAILCVIGVVSYPRKRTHLVLLIGLAMYGTALELLQSFVPGREASIADVIANTFGVFIGFAASRFSRNSEG